MKGKGKRWGIWLCVAIALAATAWGMHACGGSSTSGTTHTVTLKGATS